MMWTHWSFTYDLCLDVLFVEKAHSYPIPESVTDQSRLQPSVTDQITSYVFRNNAILSRLA
jgi:hypothetical protein